MLSLAPVVACLSIGLLHDVRPLAVCVVNDDLVQRLGLSGCDCTRDGQHDSFFYDTTQGAGVVLLVKPFFQHLPLRCWGRHKRDDRHAEFDFLLKLQEFDFQNGFEVGPSQRVEHHNLVQPIEKFWTKFSSCSTDRYALQLLCADSRVSRRIEKAENTVTDFV